MKLNAEVPFNAGLFTAVLGGPGTGGGSHGPGQPAPDDVWLAQPAPDITAKSNTKQRICRIFGLRIFTPPFGLGIESAALLEKVQPITEASGRAPRLYPAFVLTAVARNTENSHLRSRTFPQGLA